MSHHRRRRGDYYCHHQNQAQNLSQHHQMDLTDTTTMVRPAKQRRSLRQNVKHILRFISTRPQKAQTIGSGILRRGDVPTPYSPSALPPSTAIVPSFPAVGLNQYDLDLEPRIPDIDAATTSTTCATLPSTSHTPHPLLPATSLSHFDLRGSYLRHAAPPQQIALASVHDLYRDGASYHASVATLAPSNVAGKSASTLRLRPSFTTSLPNSTTLSLETLSTLFTDSDSSASSATDLSSAFEKQYYSPAAPAPPPQDKDQSIRSRAHSSSSSSSSPWDPFSVVKLFQSFCVLDTAVRGAPVTATSTELRYIFEIGEQFFLNNHECKEASMDLVMGSDAAGNQVTHLVLFSPLVSPSSGRSRFMLAALVDVTEFVTEAASLPSLDAGSEDGSVGDDVATPPLSASALDPWSSFTVSLELSSEDLLGGCYISEQRPRLGLEHKQTEDIWLDLAATESKPKSSAARHARSHKRANKTHPPLSSTPATATTTTPSSTDTSIDDVLDQFVSSLQSLYSDFFLLGKNALDDSVYEICNVSPKVYASKEYTNGHLSKCSGQVIAELSYNLAQDRPFCQHVRWGTHGDPKQLYCSPLYGQNSLTWICFLVDDQLPALW